MRHQRSSRTRAGLRSHLAGGAVRLVAATSRRLGLGGGSTIGGRVGLAIDPGLLSAAGAGRRIALVSGTNGKTTTTRLLAAALEAAGPGPGAVATSPAGANLPAGLVTALLGTPSAPLAALEVDEAYLPQVVAALSPAVVVLLNLSRDQLDRVSEVRRTAARWREALAGTGAVVVATADDPLVVWAAGGARRARFVATGATWRADAHHCPACDARLSFEEGAWSCTCGLRRPDPQLVLEDGALVDEAGHRHRLALGLPGRFNEANAALAAAGANELGVPLEAAIAAMASVHEVAGRFASVPFEGATLRLLLAKNPAGFDELLGLVAEGDEPVLVAVNAREADGRDPSWLWDVPFERLVGRVVIAGGERRLDLAVRLRHAGIAHELAADPVAALARLARSGAGRIEVVGNYTAFQDLRRRLGQGLSAPGAGQPARGAPAPLAAGRTRPAGTDERTAADRGTSAGTHAVPPPGRPRGSRPSALRIVVVHPDLLGTYGDGGNGLVLANRARWRGEPVELLLAPSDRPLPESGDLYCLGGGEDGPQGRSAEMLAGGGLARAVAGGAAVLAVCAGFQILGASFPDPGGQRRAGLDLIEVDTRRTGEARAVGELLVAPDPGATGLLGALAGQPLSGFENHASRTELGPSAAPLGSVRHGVGNDGRVDGAVQGTVVGTYLHGPVLARNPHLADALLRLVLGSALAPLDDTEEQALRAERLARIQSPRRARPRVG